MFGDSSGGGFLLDGLPVAGGHKTSLRPIRPKTLVFGHPAERFGIPGNRGVSLRNRSGGFWPGQLSRVGPVSHARLDIPRVNRPVFPGESWCPQALATDFVHLLREGRIDPDRLGGRGIGIHSLRKTAINDAIRNGATMHKVLSSLVTRLLIFIDGYAYEK